MTKGKSDKITYKPYNQGQAYLIPPSGDKLIPANYLVRLVSEVIDQMDRGRLLRKYQTRGGASRYHPEMMTKRFVYGYLTKVCSSRMLAKAAWENVLFMWLSGGQRPDFRTLNDFRGKMLKGKGSIKRENYVIDGTKIESAAGRYTFAWKKGVERNDKKLDEKLRAYIRMAETIGEDENREYREKDLEAVGGKDGFTSREVKELACALREGLEKLDGEKDGECKKKLKSVLKRVENDWLPRKGTYEKAKRTAGERNSYSKTDPDGTFMSMNEDHRKTMVCTETGS
ncbi:putative IS1182 family transposase ISBf5 [Hollandina sp. SP2]